MSYEQDTRITLPQQSQTTMEALKQLFKAKADFVKSSDENDNAPSDAQLASFLRNLTQETGLAIRGAPPAVRLLYIKVLIYLSISPSSADACMSFKVENGRMS